MKSVPVVLELGAAYGVEMPIAEGMYEVIVHGRPAVDAYPRADAPQGRA